MKMEESKMRIFKKLLLAAGLVGVLGTLGFAGQAKAATSASLLGDQLTYDLSDEVASGTVDIFVGGVRIATGQPTKASGVSISELVNNNLTDSSLAAGNVKGSYNDDAVTAITAELTNALYKVSVEASPAAGGTVKVTKYNKAYAYGYNGDTLTSEAVENSGYEFAGWDKGENKSSKSHQITVPAEAITYTATFTKIEKTKPTGVKVTVNGSTDDVTVKVGDKIKLYATTDDGQYYGYSTANFTFDPSGYFTFDSASFEAKATKKNTDGVDISVTLKNSSTGDTVKSDNYVTVYIKAKGSSEEEEDDGDDEVELSKYKASADKDTTNFDYVTEGYTLQFIATADSESTDMKVEITDGKEYVESTKVEKNTKDKNCTIKIEFKDEKLDKGNNKATVKFRIKVDDEYAKVDDEKEKEITVYSSPTSSFTSERNVSYTMPAKVNTGTKSGIDDESDSTKKLTATDLGEIKGTYLTIGADSTLLGGTSKFMTNGASTSITEAKLLEILNGEQVKTKLNNMGKSYYDMAFRNYPSNSNYYNKNLYTETTAKLYKVVVKVEAGSATTTKSSDSNSGTKTTTSGGGVSAIPSSVPVAFIAPVGDLVATASTTTATTKEYVYYGFEGSTIDIASDLKSSGPFTSISNGFTDVASTMKIVVSGDTTRNTYVAVTGKSTSNSKLDGQNKWGQNNMPVYLMIAIVCATTIFGRVAYDKKRKSI